MKYLEKNDRCQVVSNHQTHANKRGTVHGINEHSPAGTRNILKKVIIRDEESNSLFHVDYSNVTKLDKNDKPVPYTKIEEQQAKPQNIVFGSKTKRKPKSKYNDRIIDWGEWLRLDLHDGTTIIRSHVTSNERWANSELVAKLTKTGQLKEMKPKHKGHVVRPIDSDENSWIFVNSLDEAEEYMLPFRLEDLLDGDDFEKLLPSLTEEF